MKASDIFAPAEGVATGSAAGSSDIAKNGLNEARERTIYEAASEAGALATLFRQTWENGGRSSIEFECTIRGALLRIEALCTAVCVLHGNEWQKDVDQEHRVVFGKPLGVANV